MKSSPWIWRYVGNVKSTVKILSVFVAFLENMNFNPHQGEKRQHIYSHKKLEPKETDHKRCRLKVPKSTPKRRFST